MHQCSNGCRRGCTHRTYIHMIYKATRQCTWGCKVNKESAQYKQINKHKSNGMVPYVTLKPAFTEGPALPVTTISLDVAPDKPLAKVQRMVVNVESIVKKPTQA